MPLCQWFLATNEQNNNKSYSPCPGVQILTLLWLCQHLFSHSPNPPLTCVLAAWWSHSCSRFPLTAPITLTAIHIPKVAAPLLLAPAAHGVQPVLILASSISLSMSNVPLTVFSHSQPQVKSTNTPPSPQNSGLSVLQVLVGLNPTVSLSVKYNLFCWNFYGKCYKAFMNLVQDILNKS